MFGAGLPVLAAGFAALPELVAHGANGLVFNSPQELAGQLAEVLSELGAARKKKETSERGGSGGRRRSSFSTSGPLLSEIPGGALGYGDGPRLLASLRSTVASTRAGGWEASWGRTVAPLFGGVKG